MRITFLYHSSFLVELEQCSLLFDWYGGQRPPFDPTKPLYVLASHGHGDHYSPEIFSLGMENVWYVLSTHISLSAKRKAALGIVADHVMRLMAGETVTLGPLEMTTLKSTDEGVAFLVRVEGKTLYHAGDLQWWYWEGEPDPWNPDMERAFKAQCKKLEGLTMDAAFLVLDPRQEGDFWRGFDWYLRTFRAKAAFPMHCWGDFSLVEKLKAMPCSQPYRDCMVEIRENGQTFSL